MTTNKTKFAICFEFLFPKTYARFCNINDIRTTINKRKAKHFMFGNTTTQLNDGSLVSTASVTLKKYNDAVTEYNSLKYWWMKSIPEMN